MSTSGQHLLLGRQIRKYPDLEFHNLLRSPTYGPVLAIRERPFSKRIKDEAWNHVIDNEPGIEVDIKTKYISALRSIEGEARAAYADGILTNLTSNDFIDIMLKDTCLFLQLVLFWFGADLRYPPEHLVFGSNRDEKNLRKWMASMFIVGNQIPLVVLEKMIGQSFFRQVIEGTSQWKQPVGLLETVLYKFLLASAILVDNQLGRGRVQKPCDLLHGLHYLMVLGSVIEENAIEVSYVNNAANDADQRFRSAKELSQKSIRFKGFDHDHMGIRGICFKPNMLRGGVLYLPCLIVDDNTELLFQCLEAYEIVQQLREREVSSYLRFLSRLVSTIEDAEILASQGVIDGEFKKLPGILRSGLTYRDIDFSRNLHDLRLEINYYSRPRYQKLKQCIKYCGGAAVVVPTVFTALPFFKKLYELLCHELLQLTSVAKL